MPVMQRRHFEVVASAVKATRERADVDKDALLAFVTTLADTLQETNPNFRRAQFLIACGFPGPAGEATYTRPRRRRDALGRLVGPTPLHLWSNTR